MEVSYSLHLYMLREQEADFLRKKMFYNNYINLKYESTITLPSNTQTWNSEI